ncbi:type III PLP-dependent enzyme [Thermotoga sp. RQ2]|uniref:type III PLP-dependent enzyme n=1 Tax=Thermotoga sp. (strain RQ2) TaxID=126740 RepID=UPI0001601752|nr:type III PLP-dependent enzyme [Thermotoga sp. RQ2]ACB09297.1 Orn/DAP/Arg decarboxylase 2 [Thermotoga sp. RQ2]
MMEYWIRRALEVVKTPFLLFDLSVVEKKYLEMKAALKKADIYYAVKANSHPRIISLLARLGSNFDVASKGEIEKLLALGVDGKRMSFGNTIKREEDIAFAYKNGIRLFAVDSEMEVEKVAINAPGSFVFVRVETDGADADWPLSRKFGTNPEHALQLLSYASKMKLIPAGLSFHVGSQNLNPESWKKAIEIAGRVFKKAMRSGLNLFLLNVGGGFPVQHTKPIPSMEEIGKAIEEAIDENLWFVHNLRVIAEPGRYMVGEAGWLVTKVLLKSERSGEKWVYIDAGVFHGLAETIQNFEYEVRVLGKEREELEEYHLAGPTCDSVDVIYDRILLPKSITLNDLVCFINAGAYTVEYNTRFNGIEPPKMVFIEELTEISIEEKIKTRVLD